MLLFLYSAERLRAVFRNAEHVVSLSVDMFRVL